MNPRQSAALAEASGEAAAWRPRARPGVSVTGFSALLLQCLAFLTLYRATQMWFGYPTSQSEQASVDPVIMQMVLYSTIPLSALYIALCYNAEIIPRLRRMPLLVLLTGFFVLASLYFSYNKMASFRALLAVAAISLPMLLFRWRFGLAEYVDLLRKFAVVAAIVNLAYLIVFPRYAIMTGSLSGAVRGMFVHKNIFGEFFAICVVALMPPYKGAGSLRQLTYLIGLVGCVLCVLLSRSSTSVVLVVVGAGIVAASWMIDRIPGRSYRIVATALTALLALPLFLVLNTLVAEIIAASFGKDLTFSGRTEIWEALWPRLFDHPLTGHGFGMMRQPSYMEKIVGHLSWVVHSTHNSYLELFLNIGLVGGPALILFILQRFFGTFVHVPGSAAGRVAKGRAVAIMTMVLVGAMTEAGDFLSPLTIWPILVGLLPYDVRAPGSAYAAQTRRPADVRPTA